MRIISDFHDYYDAAQSMGQDRTLIYQRQKRKIWSEEEKTNLKLPLRLQDRGWHLIRFYNLFVGFCGQLYPLVEIQRNEQERYTKHCYSIEQVDAWIVEHCSLKEQDIYKGKPYYEKHAVRRNWPVDGHRSEFIKYFDNCQAQEQFVGPILEKYNVPLFIAENQWHNYKQETLITLNGSLKEVEFYRVFDTYRTYQEISMYLGNFVQPRKPIPAISDEIMAEAKGFDRFSFRKEKKR
jgi:hypothetical protein